MINFLKTAGQIITGGIGIVDGKLKYRDSEGDLKEAKSFKEYRAYCEQINDNAPVVINEIVNDFGDIIFARITDIITGDLTSYRLATDPVTPVFTLGKTIVFTDGFSNPKDVVMFESVSNTASSNFISIIPKEIETGNIVDFEGEFQLHIIVYE